MSFTRIFLGVMTTSLGFTPPLGGGGGGGGGAAIARSIEFLGRSSCSISQIVLTHIDTNTTTWSKTAAPSSGGAHLGILRRLSASKLPNIGPSAVDVPADAP